MQTTLTKNNMKCSGIYKANFHKNTLFSSKYCFEFNAKHARFANVLNENRMREGCHNVSPPFHP